VQWQVTIAPAGHIVWAYVEWLETAPLVLRALPTPHQPAAACHFSAYRAYFERH